MQVGDLVRHIQAKEAIGIVTKVGHKEIKIKVLWCNGDHLWTVNQRMEAVCK